VALSPETMRQFNPYLTCALVRSKALQKELKVFTSSFQEDLAESAELAELVGRIGATLEDMLSRQNTRTTPLHVRMVQGASRVFMRKDREGVDHGLEFDLKVLNETARAIRRPKLQISR
jgi:hypothetical protein